MSEVGYDYLPGKIKPSIKKLENGGKKDFTYRASQKFLKTAIDRIWGKRFKIEGAENVPSVGSAIIVVNHPSHIDDLFLIAAIDRPMHFIGRQEKAFNPLLVKATYPSFGVISVAENLKEGGKRFFKQINEVVENKELICIYPERLYVEDRPNKNEVGEFASGVFHIVKRHNLSVIPVFLDGTQNVRPSSRADKFFQPMHLRQPVKIVIGKSIPPTQIQNAEQVRQAIIGLKK